MFSPHFLAQAAQVPISETQFWESMSRETKSTNHQTADHFILWSLEQKPALLFLIFNNNKKELHNKMIKITILPLHVAEKENNLKRDELM